MTALLWKDYRVNRLVLGLGIVLLLGPFLIFFTHNLYTGWRFGETHWWPHWWIFTCIASLGGSLITIAALGGNAIAGERIDRSAEFLAYLPPSRLAVITSKIILTVGAGLLIWIVNLAVLYGVVPLASALPNVAFYAGDGDPMTMIPLFAAATVMTFGAAWLSSALMSSPGVATGIGIVAPWVVALALGLVDYLFYLTDAAVVSWFKITSVTLGLLCFVVGTVYYLRRVEPETPTFHR